MRTALDRAIERAPQDDRVWLGRGYLALREGRLDEAQSWFDACRRKRPDDPAVWRARLEWAMAADRTGEAAEALPHLDVNDFPPARVHEIRAWFAARRGDSGAERQALEHAIAADLGDGAALERLAELATREGRADDAARLRRRKAELDQALHRYRTMFREDDPLRSTARMARLAEALGRRFEALGLWTLVRELAPDDAEARAAVDRLAHAKSVRPGAGRKLADVLVGAISAAAEPIPRPLLASAAAPRRVVPIFRDDAGAAGLHFTFVDGATEKKQLPEASSGGVGLLDYDGDGRLDVYLVQGGAFPPAASRRPWATACSAAAATGRSRTSPVPPAWPDSPAAMDMASPWATTTTTDDPTCSSPDGGPTRSTTTAAMGRSRTRPRPRALAAIATGRRHRPSPISTATAISTCMSAITSSGMPRSPRSAGAHRRDGSTPVTPCGSPPGPTTSFATIAGGSWTSRRKRGSLTATAAAWA